MSGGGLLGGSRPLPRRLRLALVLACALAALAVVPASRGSVPLRESDGTIVKWFLDVPGQANIVSGKLTYYVNPHGSIDVPSSGTDEKIALRKAFDTWENVDSSRLAFSQDQTRLALKRDSTDRINLIQWEEKTIGPLTLALTFPFSQNGVMTDSDLILNDDFDWETSTPGTEFTADVQSVVTHEIGHMLGLDHSPLVESTMYFALPLGSISARSLAPDDVAGLTGLYPNDRTDYDLGTIRGKATVRGKGDDRGVLLVAIDLFTRLPAASALTVTGGNYEINGLTPGQYRVFAFPLRGAGSMVPYWRASRSDYLGRAYGTDGLNPGRPELVKVKAGFTTWAVDFPDLDVETAPNEPNDDTASAVPLRINDVAIGVAESVLDQDWYRFDGEAGDRISIHLDAKHFGGDLNVTLELYAEGGTTPVARSQDLRPPIYEANRTSLDGIDTDAAVRDVTLPETGTYYVGVTFAANSNAGSPLNYYVLSLFGNALAPDDDASVTKIWPPAIPADGTYQATITVEPRNFFGDLLAPGLDVTIAGNGVGELSPVIDNGNGTYSATITSPTAPSGESFSVRMRSGTGGAVVGDAARIDYLGPPDVLRSRFFADPHRIEADGSAQSLLTLVVLDSRGVAYGPGLPVSFEFADEPDGSLTKARDEGDGSYTARVTSSSNAGSDEFRATLAGLELGLTADIRYGFTLEEVIEESLAATSALLLKPGMPRTSSRLLQKAAAQLQSAKFGLASGGVKEERKAISRVSKAAKLVKKAERKAKGMVIFPALAFELAESVRRYVSDILDEIRFNPPDPAGQRVLEKAKGSLFDGEEQIRDGRYDKALRKMARALKVAQPIR